MQQKRLGTIFLIGIVLMVFMLGFFFLKSSSKDSPRGSESQLVSNPDEPPLKLKSIGVNFEDFEFTKQKLEFGKPFMEYGFVIPGSSASSGKDKSNPQPTYVVPLGTPVRSIVDGIVVAIPTLWSGDFSVQVTQDGKMQRWIYEMEHLINPKVKVGEKVTAGQVVGEVSNFNSGTPVGFGAVEIGILKGGQTPEHVCPFAYLDESLSVPGCLTLDPIEG